VSSPKRAHPRLKERDADTHGERTCGRRSRGKRGEHRGDATPANAIGKHGCGIPSSLEGPP